MVEILEYTDRSGRSPFERDNPMDVMIAHARDEVPPPSTLRFDTPTDLERVILRCLAKDPEKRFQDTRSLAQALCKCAAADGWTQTQAAHWWQEHEEPVERPRELETVLTA